MQQDAEIYVKYYMVTKLEINCEDGMWIGLP
jgi:hypothetical protein